jgi:hypothetical protein
VAIESLASVLGLADENDQLRTVLIFAEQKIDAWKVEFFAKFALGQITPRNQNSFDDTRRDLGDPDTPWLAGWQVDLDRFRGRSCHR